MFEGGKDWFSCCGGEVKHDRDWLHEKSVRSQTVWKQKKLYLRGYVDMMKQLSFSFVGLRIWNYEGMG